MTPAKMVLLTATEDLPTRQVVDYSTNPILLCTEEEQQIKIQALIPTDGPICDKIAERSLYSNYIFSPIRMAYNKFYHATTIALMATHYLLKSPGATPNCLNIANKLHPSASTNQTNQFVLGCDGSNGALYQKFKHSQLLHLKQQTKQARSLYHQDQQALQQWRVLTNQCEERLNQMATGELDYAQDDWSKEVNRSITNLIAFIDLFKYKQKITERNTCPTVFNLHFVLVH
jgi:hypothetical protein